MSFRVETEFRIGWVPDGVGGADLVQQQANIPGVGPTLALSATGFNAQVYKNRIAEGVAGGASASSAQIQAAITASAADFNTFLTNNPAIIAAIQAWSTGGV